MKNSYRILFTSLLFFGFFGTMLSAQQSNFSIAPSPVPYPYFDEGWSDLTAGGSYIRISSSPMEMSGVLLGVKGRSAMAGTFALDAGGMFGILTGSMPGIGPMTPIYTSGSYSYVPYFTQVTGSAKITFVNFSGNLGLEVQPIRNEHFDMIFFGGLVLGMNSLTIYTPYNLIVPPPYSNAGQAYTGYTDTLTINSYPYGFQAGVQFDIALSENFRLSPFVMMNSVSGTATMTDNPGAGAAGSSSSVTIPRSTSYSFGMDIIIGDVSVGTLLQQLKSAGEGNGSAKTVIINAQYHFLTGGEEKIPETDSAADDGVQKSKYRAF